MCILCINLRNYAHICANTHTLELVRCIPHRHGVVGNVALPQFPFPPLFPVKITRSHFHHYFLHGLVFLGTSNPETIDFPMKYRGFPWLHCKKSRDNPSIDPQFADRNPPCFRSMRWRRTFASCKPASPTSFPNTSSRLW